MLDLKALLAKILDALKVDYVVEEGTIDTYTKYRKWNSGIAECWYYRNVEGVTTAVWSGTLAYKDVTASSIQTMWRGLFNATPISIHCQSLHSQFIAIIPYSYTVNGISNLRYLSWGTKSNQTVPTAIYAKGTWK